MKSFLKVIFWWPLKLLLSFLYIVIMLIVRGHTFTWLAIYKTPEDKRVLKTLLWVSYLMLIASIMGAIYTSIWLILIALRSLWNIVMLQKQIKHLRYNQVLSLIDEMLEKEGEE